MEKKINKYQIGVGIFFISTLLFLLFTLPFRFRLAAADITEMRPVTALTPVLGLIFGLPAAVGCAVGNIAADLISGYGISYALLSGAQQLLYGMLAYVLWRRLNKERNGNEFCLDSIKRLLKLFLVMAMVALVTVILSAAVNHVYNVSDLLSINNLYMFVNVFDSGILFGCPLMIAGHFLQKKVYNLKSGKSEKILTFSLNERMIINTLITGLGICILIGAAIYITDMVSDEDKTVGLWGRIFLFQTLALNF
ncbi:MAG: hypothetical protein ACI4JF_08825, partial [Oscillospiraceae bacterium]